MTDIFVMLENAEPLVEKSKEYKPDGEQKAERIRACRVVDFDISQMLLLSAHWGKADVEDREKSLDMGYVFI